MKRNSRNTDTINLGRRPVGIIRSEKKAVTFFTEKNRRANNNRIRKIIIIIGCILIFPVLVIPPVTGITTLFKEKSFLLAILLFVPFILFFWSITNDILKRKLHKKTLLCFIVMLISLVVLNIMFSDSLPAIARMIVRLPAKN
jgi:hypothetical protein